MRLLLVLGIIAIGGCLSLFSVTFASCLFLWNNIFQPLSFAKVPEAFPVAWWVLYILIISYSISLVRGKFQPRLNFYIAYIPIYLGWILISALHSQFSHAMEGLTTIIKYIAPLMLISSALSTKKDVELVAIVLTLSVAFWSTQAGVHGLIKGVSRDMGIPGGQMTDNNDFMAATVSTLPMLVYMTFRYRGKFKVIAKIGGVMMILLSISAIVFSNSRGAALGLCATVILYLIFVSKHKLKESAAICVLATIIVLLLPQTFWDRMNTIQLGSSQTESSAAERLHMMRSAYNATMDNPIFGVGPDCWLLVASTYSGLRLDPHNIWLKLSTEIGIPGLVLYLIIPFYTILRLLKTRRIAIARGDADSSALASALAIAIVGYLLPSTFLSHPFSEFLWSWYGIGNAYSVIQGTRLSANRSRVKRGLPRFRPSDSAPDGDSGDPK